MIQPGIKSSIIRLVSYYSPLCYHIGKNKFGVKIYITFAFIFANILTGNGKKSLI